MPDKRIHTIEGETPTAIVAPAISGIILAANPAREGVDIVNLSDPREAVSVGFGVDAVLGSGKTLTTYGSTYHMGTPNLFKGDIYAISASGNAALSISEETLP
ncbi:hypothetical protein LCGC14_2116870 [marine sediment metagenome]|uniref:Uncharacterized protein n=1 Tax=marine sediment metagenome TaxID=412755 RepID=A0A0F9GIJ4_9ZZZZ